ncbi:hypothetical protein Bbelb_333810 [Branchiostoma belcheri]|nr:hypothetical protein Bbelb_333810 [Branchiostoma belcheri]
MASSKLSFVNSRLTVFSAVLALCSYVFLRRTSVEFREEIFIQASENEVFEFLSDVRLLDFVHPYRVGAFNITAVTDDSGLEGVNYDNVERIDFFGLYTETLYFPVHTRFLRNAGEVRSSYDVMNGTIVANQSFTLHPAQRNGVNGTLVVDVSRVSLPWAYSHFTAWKGGEAHKMILGGMRRFLEGENRDVITLLKQYADLRIQFNELRLLSNDITSFCVLPMICSNS